MMTILFEAEARAEARGRAIGKAIGERNRIIEQVRKKIAKNKSFEQIVEECESTREEIYPIYHQLISRSNIQH